MEKHPVSHLQGTLQWQIIRVVMMIWKEANLKWHISHLPQKLAHRSYKSSGLPTFQVDLLQQQFIFLDIIQGY